MHVCVHVCVLVNGNKPKCAEIADLAWRSSDFRPLFFWMLFHFRHCNMMRSHSLAGQADDVQHWFFPTEELQVLITCLCTSLASGEWDSVFVQWSAWYCAGTSLCLSVVPLFRRTENYCPQISAVLCYSITGCGLAAVFPWIDWQEDQGITASSCRNIGKVL